MESWEVGWKWDYLEMKMGKIRHGSKFVDVKKTMHSTDNNAADR